jgi:N6-adenosine-specific RNA methylase IME4
MTLKPVIHQSVSQHVVLIDLPTSIQDAQSRKCPVESVQPITQPYHSTEPKGIKRDRMLQGISPARLAHSLEIERDIEAALSYIRDHVCAAGAPWSYPRLVSDHTIDNFEGESSSNRRDDSRQIRYCPIVLAPADDGNRFRCMSDLMNRVVSNPNDSTTIQADGLTFFIPSKSTFIWTGIQSVCDKLGQNSGLSTRQIQSSSPLWDLILMDPPWTNRSVRRSSSYQTNELLGSNTFISAMNIARRHLKADGLVAIWVTNKEAIEQQVLAATQSIGLFLQREWIWAKVTAHGDPVTELDGLWRKSYERLLIFGAANMTVERKVIVAVPDLHSRKPSLKRLFDEMMPPDYRALELFARSLTKGWWAGGDEVLHYQRITEYDVKSWPSQRD